MLRLVALLAALCLATPAHADGNHTLMDLAKSFWTPNGFRMPTKELMEAVQRAKLPVMDAFGTKRDVILMTLTSEHALEKMFDVFLMSLMNVTFTRKDGTQSDLAKHLVVSVMNDDSMPKCQGLAQKYGSQFVRYGDSAFSLGNFNLFTDEFYGIGFVKIATILDGVTAGVDVLFLDADQVFFRNPLPYLLARETDVMVSGDCHHHGDETPEERFPPINNNIGFVYFRHTPMVARAVMNWGYWMTEILRSGGKPWDQNTFAGAMEHVSTDVTRRHLSLAMLRPELFPYMCMGHCGCDLRGVPYFTVGKIPGKDGNGNCEKVLMEGWYAYHMPCSGDMNDKARLMAEYSEMYQRVVGPINSRSAPFQAL